MKIHNDKKKKKNFEKKLKMEKINLRMKFLKFNNSYYIISKSAQIIQ